MVNYIYNGVELAALPTVDTSTYPYALVLDITALKTSSFNYDYSVIFCSDPFFYMTGLKDGVIVEAIVFPTSSTYISYACLATSASWKKISLTPSGDDAEYTAVPVGSVYVWTSHDIINKDTGEVQYEATELEQHIFAATPSISSNLDNSKEYVFYQGDYVTGFRIDAKSNDSSSGGVLTYQWYIVENGVSKAVAGACNKSHMPSTLTLGTFQYYCIVTNTYEKYTAQSTSNVVTVIIRTIESVTPKKTKFDQQSASLGWITGKVLQYILKMDSETDDETLINGVLHLFNGDATLTGNNLEVK